MAGGNKKIHEHPNWNKNGLDKRPQDAGRKPKLVSHVIDELKASGYEAVNTQQIVDAYTLMIGLDRDALEKKLKDDNCPVLFRIVIKSMLSGKGFEIIERMIDRAHGKSLEHKKTTLEIQSAIPAQIIYNGEEFSLKEKEQQKPDTTTDAI